MRTPLPVIGMLFDLTLIINQNSKTCFSQLHAQKNDYRSGRDRRIVLLSTHPPQVISMLF